MAGDLEIGQLQEGIKNLVASVGEIKEYLGNGITRHTEVMSKLAVIVSKQDDFSAYQKTCDAERLQLVKRCDSNGLTTHEEELAGKYPLDKRIIDLESFKSTQIKAAAATGGIMAFLAYGGTKFAEKVIGWFS